VRVSTQGQARSGLGLDAQRNAIAAFAKTEGYRIATAFEEHESGKGADALDRRPKLAGHWNVRFGPIADIAAEGSAVGVTT
jgi:DNA invertase Pin-like site-specific DNA recombinase